MNVGELIKLLQWFPSELPVFFCPDDEGRIAVMPQDAVMNLVDPRLRQVIADDDASPTVPEGFVDSVVVYAKLVRDVDGFT